MAAVAKHFRGALTQGSDRGYAYLRTGAKRVALEVATVSVESRNSRRAGLTPPRLRFDRVVLSVLGRLRSALEEEVPSGTTVVLTLTAPIRLAAKTAAALEEMIRTLLAKRSGSVQARETVYGNEVRIRILRGGRVATSKLVGFVHNRESDPAVLFELTQAVLRSVGSVGRALERVSGDRWLVVAMEGEPMWSQTCRHVCSQVFAGAEFRRVLVVDSNGDITTAVE